MRKISLTLFIALVASLGTMFASDTEVDGIWYIFDDSNNTATVTFRGYDEDVYIEYYGDVVIPASISYNDKTYSVTSIGEAAFYGCTGLTSVTIPNGVTSIGENAFYRCTDLSSVNIPNGVTSIGNQAFWYCANLSSITFPNSITEIGYNVFLGCSSLNDPIFNKHLFAYLPQNYVGAYTISSGVETIAQNAFYHCIGLTSIEIPNSVTSIGASAFIGCEQLASIEIPSSVTSIGGSAFEDCDNLTSVETPAILFNEAYEIFRLKNHEMPSQIKQIKINGGELTEEGLDRIRVSYRKLETIDISMIENTDLPDVAFNGCYKLQTLALPNDLERIGYMSVAECVSLQSINIPESVTDIDARAFENCRSLKTITFGGQAASASGHRNAPSASTSQLKTIGNWAFYNCHELQNLEIPEGVTSIGDGAFYGCTYLEDLSLPASVQYIGDNTFALCAKLKKIVVNAPVPPSIQAKTFFDVKRQIPVYVPDESVDAYKNDAHWSEFDIQGASNMPQSLDQITNDQSTTAAKIFRDGQLYIIRGDNTYTLTGQEVK